MSFVWLALIVLLAALMQTLSGFGFSLRVMPILTRVALGVPVGIGVVAIVPETAVNFLLVFLLIGCTLSSLFQPQASFLLQSCLVVIEQGVAGHVNKALFRRLVTLF